MSIVEVANVCKSYPEFRLHNVSFSLERGRIAGFIGRNGVGIVPPAPQGKNIWGSATLNERRQIVIPRQPAIRSS